MSGTAVAATAATRPPGPAAAAVRRHRRWYRVAVPFLALGLVVGVTLVARQLEEPHLADPDTLAPHGTGPDGSSRLAGLLAADGVEVRYVTEVRVAQQEVTGIGPGVTLFVPKPNEVAAALVRWAVHEPRVRRVVLVAPDPDLLGGFGLAVEPGRTRWAARAVAPGCRVPEARAAGPATALRHRYHTAAAALCYDGGLVRLSTGGTEVFVVGATDPFRNRRLDEHGNAALARGLLGGTGRVVWAGALEPPPAGSPPPPPPRSPVPYQPPDRDPPPPPDRQDLRDPPPEREPEAVRDRRRSGAGGLGQLLAGYPSWLQVALGLLAALAVLIALARARRLGPPVSEPLPVLVPAAETVAGSGRLYRLARGRGATIATFREAALRRLVRAVNLPAAPPPEPAAVAAAVAARTGLPAEEVYRTLYGPPPDTDAALAAAVAALDALVAAVTRERPGTAPATGEEQP